LGSLNSRGRRGHDNVHLETNQFCGKLREPSQLPLCVSILKSDVLSLYISMLAKTFTEYPDAGRNRCGGGRD